MIDLEGIVVSAKHQIQMPKYSFGLKEVCARTGKKDLNNVLSLINIE